MPELVESKARLVDAGRGPGRRRAPTAPAPATWPARSSGPSRRWSSPASTRSPRPRRAARPRSRRPRWPRSSPPTSRSSARNGVIDFEDLLRATVWGIEEHSDVAEQIRAQYRHFVVDEYQDVNPLQQRLLDAWLGGRDDLTVVGDASQTIYSFTGATSSYLVDFPRLPPRRDRGPAGPRLPLDAAGGRAGQRGDRAGPRRPRRGCGSSWSASGPPGAEPELRIFPDEPAEAAAVAAPLRRADRRRHAARSEIAVLFRTNAQSETYEEALAEAEVPYVVRGGERFFERTEVRQAMVALRAATRSPTSAAADRGGGRGAGGGRLAPEAPADRRRRAGALGGAGRAGAAGRGVRGRAVAAAARRGRGLERRPRSPTFVEELARRAAPQHAPTVDGRDARVPALGQGAGVGRGLPGRARRGHAADHLRARRPTRSRRSGGCSTSGSPGRGSGSGCRYARPARPAGAPAAAVPVPAAARPVGRRRRPRRGTGRRESQSRQARRTVVVLPGLRRHAAGRRRPQARPVRRPVRPTSTRSCSSGCASGAPRVAAAPEGSGIRRLHRRHADRARRAPAGAAPPT